MGNFRGIILDNLGDGHSVQPVAINGNKLLKPEHLGAMGTGPHSTRRTNLPHALPGYAKLPGDLRIAHAPVNLIPLGAGNTATAAPIRERISKGIRPSIDGRVRFFQRV